MSSADATPAYVLIADTHNPFNELSAVGPFDNKEKAKAWIEKEITKYGDSLLDWTWEDASEPYPGAGYTSGDWYYYRDGSDSLMYKVVNQGDMKP